MNVSNPSWRIWTGQKAGNEKRMAGQSGYVTERRAAYEPHHIGNREMRGSSIFF